MPHCGIPYGRIHKDAGLDLSRQYVNRMVYPLIP